MQKEEEWEAEEAEKIHDEEVDATLEAMRMSDKENKKETKQKSSQFSHCISCGEFILSAVHTCDDESDYYDEGDFHDYDMDYDFDEDY